MENSKNQKNGGCSQIRNRRNSSFRNAIAYTSFRFALERWPKEEIAKKKIICVLQNTISTHKSPTF